MLELLIALVILGVIVAQMATAMISQGATQRSQQRGLDALDAARLSLDVIVSDARNAGFMVPRWAGVAAVDGGATGADRLCVSNTSYFDLPAPGDTATSALDLRIDRFPGSVVTAIVGSADVALNSFDIDEFPGTPPGPDFAAGAGVILARSDGAPNPAFPPKGIATHCARIEAVDVTNGRLRLVGAHAIPGGLFTGVSNLVAVPATVYEIDAGLLRNGTRLSDLVEDLQVELWVDVVGTPNGVIDGANEFPINDLNQMTPALRDSARIRRLQVTVVARSAMREEVSGQFRRPAVANRTAGADDGFARKVMQAGVLPRNLLDPNAYGLVP